MIYYIIIPYEIQTIRNISKGIMMTEEEMKNIKGIGLLCDSSSI